MPIFLLPETGFARIDDDAQVAGEDTPVVVTVREAAIGDILERVGPVEIHRHPAVGQGRAQATPVAEQVIGTGRCVVDDAGFGWIDLTGLEQGEGTENDKGKKGVRTVYIWKKARMMFHEHRYF
jgi:hypothetical protein